MNSIGRLHVHVGLKRDSIDRQDDSLTSQEPRSARKSRMRHHGDPITMTPQQFVGEGVPTGKTRPVKAAPSMFRPASDDVRSVGSLAPDEDVQEQASTSEMDPATLIWGSGAKTMVLPGDRPAIKNLSSLRISWIDIARGLAVIFAVITCISEFFDGSAVTRAVSGFCGAFAFPLLFLMCGYTTTRSDLSIYRIGYLARRYLVPYIVASVLIVLMSCAISGEWDITSWLWSVLFASGGVHGDPLGAVTFNIHLHSMGILWVLPVLFVARVATYVLTCIPMITRMLAAAILYVVASGTSGDMFLPFALQASGCAVWFMVCGTTFREIELFKRCGWERAMVALTASIGIVYAIVLAGPWLSVPEYGVAFFHQPAIDMFGGACASIFIMVIAQIIGEVPGIVDIVLEWCGRNIVPLISWDAIALLLVPVAYVPIDRMFPSAIPEPLGFVVSCLFVFVIASFMALLSYKLPFLHLIFCSSASSSESLVASEGDAAMGMTLIEEQEVA